MNKTIEFMKKSWPLLINALVGVIIVIFILFFHFSLSKHIFGITNLSDAIAIDFTILIPVFSFLLISFIGFMCDIFVNDVNIEVSAVNSKDLEVKIDPPSPNDIPTGILISTESKKKEKRDKFIEIECPFWLSFQPSENQKIVIEKNDTHFINLKYLSYSKEKDCYTANIKCYILNNGKGTRNTNSFVFKKIKSWNIFKKFFYLKYDSILFTQLEEGDPKK